MILQKLRNVAFAMLALKLTIVSGFSVVLDQASDEDALLWDIGGFVEYFRDGNAVSGTISQYLPRKFDYAHILLSKGIWAVVPSSGTHCNDSSTETSMKTSEKTFKFKLPIKYATVPDKQEVNVTEASECNRSSSASFKFHFVAQLADSMKVRYCFGGANATIRILNGNGLLLRELTSDNRAMDYWDEETAKLDGHAMELEAFVEGEGDYILIDSITVNTLEATTTTPTTTRKPPPVPTSGQKRIFGMGSLIWMMASSLFIAAMN